MPEIVELVRAFRGRPETAFPPFVAIVGTETFLIERAIELLRNATVGNVRGINEDVVHAKTTEIEVGLRAARTVPMFTKGRFVLVRDGEHLDASKLEKVAEYAASPVPSTCFVFTAQKLDGRGKLARTGKKEGYWYDAEPLRGSALRGFIQEEAKIRGHQFRSDAADMLLDIVGADLSALDDALERLSLFVGEGQPITTSQIPQVVASTKVDTVWALVDSISARDSRPALSATASLLADREPPLRILAMISRQLRIVTRMKHALSQGMQPQDAAVKAGAPPFKARELQASAARFSFESLHTAARTIRDADLSLKGSRTPGDVALFEHVLKLVTNEPLPERRNGLPPRAGFKRTARAR